MIFEWLSLAFSRYCWTNAAQTVLSCSALSSDPGGEQPSAETLIQLLTCCFHQSRVIFTSAIDHMSPVWKVAGNMSCEEFFFFQTRRGRLVFCPEETINVLPHKTTAEF